MTLSFAVLEAAIWVKISASDDGRKFYT